MPSPTIIRVVGLLVTLGTGCWLLSGHPMGTLAAGPQPADRGKMPHVSRASNLHSRPLPADTGVMAGVTTLHTQKKLQIVAHSFGGAFDEPAAKIADRLHRLQDCAGAGLYIQIEGVITPFQITLVPSETQFASFSMLSAQVPAIEGAQNETVVVLWITSGAKKEYEVQVPASILAVTVVANGEVIFDAQRLRYGAGGALIFRVD